MKSLGKLISTIAGITFVALLLLFVTKGCVISVWSPPKIAETYEIESVDGRSMIMVFMPNHETIICYIDSNEGSVESILLEMRGTYGTHYFGPLWRIEGPGIWFGYRWYSGNVKPIFMEINIKKKYFEGTGEPSFSPVGKTIYAIILKGEDRIKFDGMWLQKKETNRSLIIELYSKLISGQ